MNVVKTTAAAATGLVAVLIAPPVPAQADDQVAPQLYTGDPCSQANIDGYRKIVTRLSNGRLILEIGAEFGRVRGDISVDGTGFEINLGYATLVGSARAAYKNALDRCD